LGPANGDHRGVPAHLDRWSSLSPCRRGRVASTLPRTRFRMSRWARPTGAERVFGATEVGRPAWAGLPQLQAPAAKGRAFSGGRDDDGRSCTALPSDS